MMGRPMLPPPSLPPTPPGGRYQSVMSVALTLAGDPTAFNISGFKFNFAAMYDGVEPDDVRVTVVTSGSGGPSDPSSTSSNSTGLGSSPTSTSFTASNATSANVSAATPPATRRLLTHYLPTISTVVGLTRRSLQQSAPTGPTATGPSAMDAAAGTFEVSVQVDMPTTSGAHAAAAQLSITTPQQLSTILGMVTIAVNGPAVSLNLLAAPSPPPPTYPPFPPAFPPYFELNVTAETVQAVSTAVTAVVATAVGTSVTASVIGAVASSVASSVATSTASAVAASTASATAGAAVLFYLLFFSVIALQVLMS